MGLRDPRAQVRITWDSSPGSSLRSTRGYDAGPASAGPKGKDACRSSGGQVTAEDPVVTVAVGGHDGDSRMPDHGRRTSFESALGHQITHCGLLVHDAGHLIKPAGAIGMVFPHGNAGKESLGHGTEKPHTSGQDQWVCKQERPKAGERVPRNRAHHDPEESLGRVLWGRGSQSQQQPKRKGPNFGHKNKHCAPIIIGVLGFFRLRCLEGAGLVSLSRTRSTSISEGESRPTLR